MLTRLRKLSWVLLLPFLLLFAQQGELRHEYGHYAQQASALACKKAPADTDHCLQCLAYAHMAGAIKADVSPPSLLAGLTFYLAPAFDVAGIDGPAASPRSRGPPSV